MIRAVLFDMDGTVLDTEQLMLWGWKQLIKEGYLSQHIVDVYPDYCGKTHPEMRRMFFEHYGEDLPLDDLYKKRAAHINRRLEEKGMPLKPGVPEVFEALRARGYRMALATSTGDTVVARNMEMTGLAHYFDTIVTGSMIQNSKPAPDIFLLAAEKLGVRPEECMVIEDSHAGVRAGVAAGMKVIMVPDIPPVTDEMRALSWRICKTLHEVADLVDLANRKAQAN